MIVSTQEPRGQAILLIFIATLLPRRKENNQNGKQSEEVDYCQRENEG
jgi:hypothetical protein